MRASESRVTINSPLGESGFPRLEDTCMFECLYREPAANSSIPASENEKIDTSTQNLTV